MNTYTPTRKELEERFDAFFKLNLPDMQGTSTMAAHLATSLTEEYILIPRKEAIAEYLPINPGDSSPLFYHVTESLEEATEALRPGGKLESRVVSDWKEVQA